MAFRQSNMQYDPNYVPKVRTDKQVYAWNRLKYLGWLSAMNTRTNYEFHGIVTEEENRLIIRITEDIWKLRQLWKPNSENGGMKFKPKKPEPPILIETTTDFFL